MTAQNAKENDTMSKTELIQLIENTPDGAQFLVWDAPYGIWTEPVILVEQNRRDGMLRGYVTSERHAGLDPLPMVE